MPFSHPHENEDSAFERFAERASNFTSRWLFFVLMLLLACAWIWAAVTERTQLEHIIVGVFTITSLFKISLLANAEKRDLQEVQREQREQREALHALLRESGVVSDGEAPARSTRG
jgi:low affinity Fe/Cu permease